MICLRHSKVVALIPCDRECLDQLNCHAGPSKPWPGSLPPLSLLPTDPLLSHTHLNWTNTLAGLASFMSSLLFPFLNPHLQSGPISLPREVAHHAGQSSSEWATSRNWLSSRLRSVLLCPPFHHFHLANRGANFLSFFVLFCFICTADITTPPASTTTPNAPFAF